MATSYGAAWSLVPAVLLGILLIGQTFVGVVKLGNVAEWVAAVGTVGTLIALALDQSRLRHQAVLDQRRQQADKVVAWCAGVFEVESPRTPLPGDLHLDVELAVRNGSDQPILFVQAQIMDWDPDQKWSVGSGTPSLGPGETWTDVVRVDLAEDALYEWVPVKLRFTDAAGRHWERLSTGEPTQLERTHWPRRPRKTAPPVPGELPVMGDMTNVRPARRS